MININRGKKEWKLLVENRLVEEIQEKDIYETEKVETPTSTQPENQETLDETTQSKIQKLEEKRKKMEEQLGGLDEEINFIKEMAKKKMQAEALRRQLDEVKNEMAMLKDGKGKPKEEMVDEEQTKYEEEQKKYEEDTQKARTTSGKTIDESEDIDVVNESRKIKGKINESFDVYMKTKYKGPGKDDKPEGFRVVLG